MSEVTPRVNSAQLELFVGRKVRLACEVIKHTQSGSTYVRSSDGGQVEILNPNISDFSSTYVEVIGNVVNATQIKFLACVNFGSELDMKLVDDCTKLMHDAKHSAIFF